MFAGAEADLREPNGRSGHYECLTMRWIRFKFLRVWRQRRREGRKWIDGHPRLERWLTSMGCLHSDPQALARGVSIGLFIGFTPTVGFQIMLMIVACTFLRGSLLAAFALSWVTNPVTMGPLYYGFYRIGEALFAGFLSPLTELSGLSGDFIEESITTFMGSLVIAIPAAIIGYFLCRSISRRHEARRNFFRERKAIHPLKKEFLR